MQLKYFAGDHSHLITSLLKVGCNWCVVPAGIKTAGPASTTGAGYTTTFIEAVSVKQLFASLLTTVNVAVVTGEATGFAMAVLCNVPVF